MATRRGSSNESVSVATSRIEQWAAGIAAVNGRVGLYVIVVRPRIDVAVARRHDAGGDGSVGTRLGRKSDSSFGASLQSA